MNEVVEIAAPVFGLAALGYLATRTGTFSEQSAEGLARFVFDWLVPVFLFRVFSTHTLPDAFPWQLLAGFYGPALLVYCSILAAGRLLLKNEGTVRVVAAMGSTFGNSVLLGLPLMLLAFGDEEAVPYLILIAVHTLILYSTSAFVLELMKHRTAGSGSVLRSSMRGLSSNPPLIGIIAGVLFNLFGLDLPAPLEQMTTHMGNAVAACSLFALGASLSRYRIAGRLPETLMVVATKNVLLPAVVWLAAVYVFVLEPAELIAVVVLASQPTGIMVYIFAERNGTGQRLATTSIFVSSILSVFTVTLFVALLRG